MNTREESVQKQPHPHVGYLHCPATKTVYAAAGVYATYQANDDTISLCLRLASVSAAAGSQLEEFNPSYRCRDTDHAVEMFQDEYRLVSITEDEYHLLRLEYEAESRSESGRVA